MNNLFPQLIIMPSELEIAHNIHQRSELLYNLAASELAQVIVLTHQGEYMTVENTPAEPLSASQLAQRVTAYLALEGHCCLAKITQLTPAQAFSLLAL